MSLDIVSYPLASAHLDASETASPSKAPPSDSLAHLWALPIQDVEATLSHRFRKNNPSRSLLSSLRTPDNGITRVQAAARILEELAGGPEDASVTTSLVVRYVQAHRLWTDHPDPAVDSLEALLGTIGGVRYVRAGAGVDTCPQSTRDRAIRVIEKHWGPDWFQKIPADMKDSTWSRASDCSHQLLKLIAANAKNGVKLETATHTWARSIRRRRDESVRKKLHMRCPRFPFITTEDVRSSDLTLGVDQQDCDAGEIVCSDEPPEHKLKLDLDAPGRKRGGSSIHEPCANETRHWETKKRLRHDFGVDSRTRTPAAGGLRVSDSARSVQRRDEVRSICVTLSDRKESHPRVALSPRDPGPVPNDAVEDLIRGSARSTDTVLCGGPAIAGKLRCVVETLALREKEDSTSNRLAGRCCADCRSKIDVLDEMIDGVIRVANLFKDLTDHRIDGI